MDKISRRSFLKSAGMTALAVAAVGMMTGCKAKMLFRIRRRLMLL